jgi:hypothetical protein
MLKTHTPAISCSLPRADLIGPVLVLLDLSKRDTDLRPNRFATAFGSTRSIRARRPRSAGVALTPNCGGNCNAEARDREAVPDLPSWKEGVGDLVRIPPMKNQALEGSVGGMRLDTERPRLWGCSRRSPAVGTAAASPDNADVNVSGEVEHAAAPLRIIFVKPDGREIEGTLADPKANGSNGHG